MNIIQIEIYFIVMIKKTARLKTNIINYYPYKSISESRKFIFSICIFDQLFGIRTNTIITLP